ncbi:MAG TPA: hypothetical protein PKD61_40450 [Polyangiaceae bacterium]|nr:hypothetical protein [Polyangiaceae bacterium]
MMLQHFWPLSQCASIAHNVISLPELLPPPPAVTGTPQGPIPITVAPAAQAVWRSGYVTPLQAQKELAEELGQLVLEAQYPGPRQSAWLDGWQYSSAAHCELAVHGFCP